MVCALVDGVIGQAAGEDNARAYGFVREGGHALSGRSIGAPPFSHVDPDTNVTVDAC